MPRHSKLADHSWEEEVLSQPLDNHPDYVGRHRVLTISEASELISQLRDSHYVDRFVNEISGAPIEAKLDSNKQHLSDIRNVIARIQRHN